MTFKKRSEARNKKGASVNKIKLPILKDKFRTLLLRVKRKKLNFGFNTYQVFWFYVMPSLKKSLLFRVNRGD